MLFRQLSPDVTVLRHTGPAVDGAEGLAARGVRFVDGRVVAVENDGTRLTGVRLEDGGRVPLDALVVAPLFLANADLVAPLGLEPVEVTMGEHVVATKIEAGPAGATAAAGVWVAGNVAEPMAQLMSAAAAGLMAGAVINADLAVEDAALVLTR
jgi:thioredoxin reductase (NADPH)